MSRAAFEQLLAALEALGRGAEAQAWREGPAGREPGPGEIQAVAAAIAAPPQATPPPDPGPEAQVPAALQPYEPFLRSMPRWEKLLAALSGLLSASRNWDRLLDAGEELFCEELGFDRDRVDLTGRLQGRSAVERFVHLGRFGSFSVCAVLLTRKLSDTRWASTSEHYRPCFRLIPRGLLISLQPGSGALRLVYRNAEGPRYRCITGPWFLRDANETLLTVLRRFELLRPDLGDSDQDYAGRVRAALDCEVGHLAPAWASAPFDAYAEEPPGQAWSGSGPSAMERALDPDTAWWGLDGALRHIFPTPLVWDQLYLGLVGWTRLPTHGDARTCWKQGRTLETRLRLDLQLLDWQLAPLDTFQLEVSLPVPEADGTFWIEGEPYRHVPTIDADGHVVGARGSPWEDDDDDPEDELDDEPEEEAQRRTSAALDSLLCRSVEERIWRKLKHLRRILRRERSWPAKLVRARWLGSTPPGAPWPLVTPAQLRLRLERQDPGWAAGRFVELRSATLGHPRTPPAWACRALSGALPAGAWASSRAARPHPCGGLALPQGEGTTLRLQASTASTEAPARWSRHPSLPPDFDERCQADPVQVAMGRALPIRTVSGPALDRAHLAPPRRPALRLRTHLDVPAWGEAPELLVHAGQALEPGASWLALDASGLAAEVDLEDAKLLAVGEPAPGEGGCRAKLPWEASLRVVDAGLEELRSVGVRYGWRAWIEVEALGHPGALLASDGVAHAIETAWRPEDLPWQLEEDHPEAALPGGEGAELYLDGRTGEPLSLQTRVSVWWIPPALPSRRGGYGQVDGLPRVALARAAEPWSVTRLRLAAGDAPLDLALRLPHAWSHAELVAWAAGLDPDPEGTEFERIPSVTQAHRVGAFFTASPRAIRCQCGVLAGRGFLGARCTACGSRVLLAPAEPARRAVISLSGHFLHPWGKPAAAALLGLLPRELEQLLRAHGPQPVVELLMEACESPTRAASARLALPSGHPRALAGGARRELGRWVERLRDRGADELFERLVLRRVGVPSRAQLGVGTTLGEARPVGGELMARYAHLLGNHWARERAHRTRLPGLRTASDIQLQRSLDRVFGDPDEHDPGTLAGLLRCARPWTRASAPGCALPPTRPPRPQDDEAWERQARRSELIERWSAALIAALWSLPADSLLERRARVRLFARTLLHPEFRAGPLLEVVGSRRALPLRLPRERAELEGRWHELLQRSLPQELDEELMSLLTGWWTGPPSASRPSGMMWVPLDAPSPPAFQRVLPGLGDPCWGRWMHPVLPRLDLAVLEGLAQEPALIGSAEGAEPTFVEPRPAPSPPSPSPRPRSPVPAPTRPSPSPPDDGGIRVTDLSVTEWLTQ